MYSLAMFFNLSIKTLFVFVPGIQIDMCVPPGMMTHSSNPPALQSLLANLEASVIKMSNSDSKMIVGGTFPTTPRLLFQGKGMGLTYASQNLQQ